MSSVAPALAAVKQISEQNEAKALGEFDAQRGVRCQPDAYQYPNDVRRNYLRADYIYSFITAKGL